MTSLIDQCDRGALRFEFCGQHGDDLSESGHTRQASGA